MHPNGRINTNPVDSHTVGILKEQFKNRTLNLELCMQQQRSNSGTRPLMLTHPVDSYQYGTEWLMHGPQPHGVGLPLYGQPAMHGHGGTQVGVRYVPQGYMHPVTQHYYPVFPNIQIPHTANQSQILCKASMGRGSINFVKMVLITLARWSPLR